VHTKTKFVARVIYERGLFLVDDEKYSERFMLFHTCSLVRKETLR